MAGFPYSVVCKEAYYSSLNKPPVKLSSSPLLELNSVYNYYTT